MEHKGSQKYNPIDTSLPPWTTGVQFYNGGMEKYRFALKYAEEWYKMFIGSGVLTKRYGITAPIPTLKEWIERDAKSQADPRTEYGKELKRKYRALHNNEKVSLYAERDEFVREFSSTLCTENDCIQLKEDITPIVKEVFEQKHYWIQIHGNIESGKFYCAWTKQLPVSIIKNIKIVLQSDIWINIECENNLTFRGILRFGKGSGYSNIRIDLRD